MGPTQIFGFWGPFGGPKFGGKIPPFSQIFLKRERELGGIGFGDGNPTGVGKFWDLKNPLGKKGKESGGAFQRGLIGLGGGPLNY